MQSIAQKHGVASFFESLLVGLGPSIVNALIQVFAYVTDLSQSAASCPPPGPGQVAAGVCTMPHYWIIVLQVLGLLVQLFGSAIIRGFQGWLIAMHAPTAEPTTLEGETLPAGVHTVVVPSTPTATAVYATSAHN